MIKPRSFNTIIYCRDWQATVDFYRCLLNAPVLTSLDWFIELELGESARLSIADESRASIESNQGKGITLSFEVGDIQATRSCLDRLGIQDTVVEQHPWGAEVIFIHDPEGNRIELWAPR